MEVIKTHIPDVVIIKPKTHGDDRGFFMETFRDSSFSSRVCRRRFVQDNHSKSRRGILRGLHYQTVQTQGKLVRVVSGEVYDVAVDMRKSSDTFGQHFGIVLSETNNLQLWVPEGFAHGFYVMSNSAEFVYKCTDYYAPEFEVSLKWDDPAIGITWPLTDGTLPSLSEQDENGFAFADAPYFD